MLVLFDFTGKEPGIGTISSIKSPILLENEKENVMATVRDIWVKERTKLVVRWPKEFDSVICERVYEKNNRFDCDHRSAVALAISTDQEYLLELMQQLILDKTSAKNNLNGLHGLDTRQKTRRTLVFPDDTTKGAPYSVAKKSKHNPTEDLLVEELTDTLEMLRSWCEQPRELAQQMKEKLLQLNDAISNFNRRPEFLPPTPSASPQQSAAKRMVPFDGDIAIEYNALRDAICYGREGQSKDSLNAMVRTLIDYFIPPNEQAEYSLTGRPCRSIPNSMPKKPFPISIIDAMTNFILTRWKTWHNNDLSKDQVKTAITAKLVNSHSKTKKKNLKGQQQNVEEEIFGGGTNNNDGDQQAESV
ncbi:hypothetical protein GHT06_003257 [Daphnia sinensis]|uniref:BEN domain-containing protein n=1 Tax=Daphnia sinensis TaxID=1820382 RepID=A0AAD5PQA8_9CRUS|nr:hypothetical protein GHT06_001915 [Daphnia sinensis]KAI9551325.1 hypothetical protein GHT06_003257 [Daphnia sinensis]